jgi:hypothetical protein
MIFELLYTSVPKGLKPGAKGYCTVLTTEGIPSALLERLEGYCGYRHLFSPGSPDNPEAFGHRILNLAGNTWHILSRVADAGSDYSGRSNLIGHFMAISEDELKGISAGPTSFMMSDGFFRTVLEGEPRRVSESETRKRLGNVTDKIQQALTWATVTGHAGWAGRLVQVTEESSDSIALVYPLRTKTLKLLDEAASILPKHKQWDITFNTFFTKSGEECRWRCYCADVTEAGPFKGGEFDLVEVKKDGVPPVDSPYAEAAINGKKVGASPAAKSAPVAKVRTPIKSDSDRSLEASQSFADKRQAKKEGEDFLATITKDTKQSSVKPTQHSLEVLPRQAGPLPPPVNRAARSIDLLNDVINDGKNSRNRKSQRPDTVNIVLSVIVCVLLFIVIFLGRDKILSKPNPAGVEITKGDAKKAEPIAGKPIEELPAGKPSEAKGNVATGGDKPSEAKGNVATGGDKPSEAKGNVATGGDKPSEAKVMGPSVTVTKEAANVNALTELSVSKGVKGNLIVPLDVFLKDKIKNNDEFAKIKEKGVIINIDTAINLAETIIVTDIETSTKKSLKIKKIEKNKLQIEIPKDLEENDIEKTTFAFCKISQSEELTLQFFLPISLKLQKVLDKNELLGVSGIDFIVDNDNSKHKRISAILDVRNTSSISSTVYKTQEYESSSSLFYMAGSSGEITKETNNRVSLKSKEYCIFVDPKTPEINSKTSNGTILSFSEVSYYVPLLFNEKSKKEGALEGEIINYQRLIKETKNPSKRDLYSKEIMKREQRKLELKQINGEYIIACDYSSIPLPRLWVEFNALLEAFEPKPDNIVYEHNGLGVQVLNFLEIKYSSISPEAQNQNIKVQIKKLFDSFREQLQEILSFIKTSPPDFDVYYKLAYKIDKPTKDEDAKIDDAEIKKQNAFKNTKIVVYTYKQPKKS